MTPPDDQLVMVRRRWPLAPLADPRNRPWVKVNGRWRRPRVTLHRVARPVSLFRRLDAPDPPRRFHVSLDFADGGHFEMLGEQLDVDGRRPEVWVYVLKRTT